MPLVYKKYTDTDRKIWDKFIKTSPQNNIFSQTKFLDSLKVDYDFLMIEKNNQPLLGAIVVKKDNQLCQAPFSFLVYQGILFSPQINLQPDHRRTKIMLEITALLLSKMEKDYSLISFSLHPSLTDLRSFQWFHYHKPEKGQFKINLRYTGIISSNQFKNFYDYLAKIRKVRRQEYQQAKQNKLIIKSSDNIEQLDYLHKLTFKRQGIRRSKKTSENLKNIAKAALLGGWGELLLCRNIHDKVIGATLFLNDKKCAYYLVGANHPDYRNTRAGTFLFLENIKRCFAKKIKIIDVCGINSPNRGDFKTSFNAAPVPYFEVTWQKPSR